MSYGNSWLGNLIFILTEIDVLYYLYVAACATVFILLVSMMQCSPDISAIDPLIQGFTYSGE